MFANKLDKTTSTQVGRADALIIFIYLNKVLRKLIAYRNHHSPADGKLPDQCSGMDGARP